LRKGLFQFLDFNTPVAHFITMILEQDMALRRFSETRRSHPLAGSEKCGVEFARADLFDARVVVVTPSRRTSADDAQAVADFWSGLGASVLMMSPEAHDKALAATSHLPHLVASALAAKTTSADLPLTASGWRDVTRIAAGDPKRRFVGIDRMVFAKMHFDANVLHRVAGHHPLIQHGFDALFDGRQVVARQAHTHQFIVEVEGPIA
jgi:hypothetical protein